ncbi:hypothetical protein [Burkholderia ubonensis]|uniref:hypothetical protein n=1 Tax=Burkholderia ubonensis TaxID=101571 RepID=UPI000AACA237|nr:hypothetical protein [Burkholderia ubonensis]
MRTSNAVVICVSCILFGNAIAVSGGGVATQAESSNQMENVSMTATFAVGDKELTLGREQFEALRMLALDSLTKSERYREFAPDLERSHLWSMDGVVRAGRWLFENRNRQVVLVMNPPRAPVMRFIVVRFAYDDGHWSVAGISDERVTGAR